MLAVRDRPCDDASAAEPAPPPLLFLLSAAKGETEEGVVPLLLSPLLSALVGDEAGAGTAPAPAEEVVL
jgi:hypothetical protein